MNDIYDALDLSNQLGPEHLIIQVNKADSYLDKIINAFKKVWYNMDNLNDV